MKILALDLATRTGWAFWDGARLESGVQDFSKQRGESNGMLFLKFNRWLGHWGTSASSIDIMHRLDLIIFEQAHHRGGASTEICVGLMTRVLEFCALHGIEHTALHSLSLKKWATGSGKASKQEMIQRAMLIVGRTVVDDNEADAVLIADYAREKFDAVKA